MRYRTLSDLEDHDSDPRWGALKRVTFAPGCVRRLASGMRRVEEAGVFDEEGFSLLAKAEVPWKLAALSVNLRTPDALARVLSSGMVPALRKLTLKGSAAL